MKIESCTTFTSPLFTPFLPEESQVNPECYGAELSWWLARELAKRNIVTSYPNYEDWGWFLEYIQDEDEFRICCANISGEKNRWQIYILAQSKKLFSRKKPAKGKIQPVIETIRQILEETDEINGIEWETEL